MQFLEILNKIGPALSALSETLGIFVEFLAKVAIKFPEVVLYLYKGVEAIFDLKDKLFGEGKTEEEVHDKVLEAQDKLVQDTKAEFHGSGPQISTMLIKGTIEALVAIFGAYRYGPNDFQQKDVKARDLGYLKSEDLEIAKQTYPQLFGKWG